MADETQSQKWMGGIPIPPWLFFAGMGAILATGGGGALLSLTSGGIGTSPTVTIEPPNITVVMPESTVEFQEAMTTDIRQIRNDVTSIRMEMPAINERIKELERKGEIGATERFQLERRLLEIKSIVEGKQ